MRSLTFTWILINLTLNITFITSSENKIKRKSSSSLSLSTSAALTARSLSLNDIDVVLDQDSDSSDSTSSVASSTIFKRLSPHSPLRQKQFSTNTLLIDREFNEEWKNIVAGLESILPHRSSSSFLSFTSTAEIKKRAQKKLISAIKKNSKKEVLVAVNSGASFLSNDLDSHIRTSNYYPIEFSVLINHLKALDAMLGYMRVIESNLLSTFYGGLMIRAVQAGQVDALKLLFTKYKAPYLKGSYLFQQAIMHHAPSSVLQFILQHFPNEPEIHEPFGRHRNFPLHLAVMYSNPVAFNFIFNSKVFRRNQVNADSLRPINLIFTLQRSNFLTDLFKRFPQLRSTWTDEFGNNLLHLSVLQGNLLLVANFVEFIEIPIDCPNIEGKTPLYLATVMRLRQIEAYLIRTGADVLRTDKSNISPLVIMARLSDYEAFNFASNSLTSKTISIVPLQNLVQILINERLFIYAEVILRKFQLLKMRSYHFLMEPINQLMLSGALWNLPNLLELFIKVRFIDPYAIIHQAAALGKVEIIKVLIANEVRLDTQLPLTGEKPIDVAIKHKQPEVTRLLLTQSGCFIPNSCSLDNFVFVLNNGGSFCPTCSSQVSYNINSVVLKLFFDYLTQILESRKFNAFELVTMCLQFEIFLFYHLSSTTFTEDLRMNIGIIQNAKEAVAILINANDQIRSQYPLLIPLLNSYSFNNSLFIRRCLNVLLQHRILPNQLSGYLLPANQYLLVEYASIL